MLEQLDVCREIGRMAEDTCREKQRAKGQRAHTKLSQGGNSFSACLWAGPSPTFNCDIFSFSVSPSLGSRPADCAGCPAQRRPALQAVASLEEFTE